MKRVLIIGGYGNFGSFIAKSLSSEKNIQLIIAGRNIEKSSNFIAKLNATNPAEPLLLDINAPLDAVLAEAKPDIVIHTSGPFQGQGHTVATACLKVDAHYIDIADGRDFVCNITALDNAAKSKNLLICSGASSVPCLTSAIIDKYIDEFKTLTDLDYGISTAQLTNRGLATTQSILNYAGQEISTEINGKTATVHGWLGLKWRKFWQLNLRPLGYCDVPDLELFPKRYPNLKSIKFRAGLEIKIMHLMLTALSSLVRIKLLPSLRPLAPLLLKLAPMFDPFGTDRSGFYMQMSGIDSKSELKTLTFDLVAGSGHGPYIPVMPAILLAKKLANGQDIVTGAQPCIGMITLDEYLDSLKPLDIKWQVTSGE